MIAVVGAPPPSSPAAVPAMPAVDPEALFAAHFPSLCRTAYLVLGHPDLAEEVVMEAFARSLGRWAAITDADQPVAYVRRVVVNLCVSRIRRLGAERRALARMSARRADDVTWGAAAVGDEDAVLDAVRALPARQRACVVLRYFDDLPEADIAGALGCSVGTVKSQLAKARASLAAALGPASSAPSEED